MSRIACLLLVMLPMCGGEPPSQERRSVTFATITQPIDWTQSVGIFIGIETFRSTSNPPEDVRYAADDATDLAWMFSKELPSLLPPERTLLLLAGWPDKRSSQEHLLVLQREGSVISDGFDAAAVYAYVRAYAEKVGPHGVLILSIATHGYTAGGAHVLLMPEATKRDPKGVVLNDLLQMIPAGHGNRVLLFLDACREPDSRMPARLFEDLRFAGKYAIFAASAPGGLSYPDEQTQNGFFTGSVLEGLRCAAKADADGFVTPGTLDVHVGTDVRRRSNRMQHPEARFGGLADLPLFPCEDIELIARIVHPPDGAQVEPSEHVDLEVLASGLSATVLLCATANDNCWKQNATPVDAPSGTTTRIGVGYGDADAFRVHVALTRDEEFLRDQTFFTSFPLARDRRAHRVVYWLKPVTVNLKEVP